MTSTLRDRLAAVLGPGNDDTTAYAQADAVLGITWRYVIEQIDATEDDPHLYPDAVEQWFWGELTDEQRRTA